MHSILHSLSYNVHLCLYRLNGIYGLREFVLKKISHFLFHIRYFIISLFINIACFVKLHISWMYKTDVLLNFTLHLQRECLVKLHVTQTYKTKLMLITRSCIRTLYLLITYKSSAILLTCSLMYYSTNLFVLGAA